MKPVRIRDIRHAELIEATVFALHKQGFHKVTLSQIAKEIGATAASVNYYFGTKDHLLEATMRHLMRILQGEMQQGYAQARTPRQRLDAVIAANFSDALFTTEQCSVWVQFWSAAPYAEGLSRLQNINRARVASNMGACLRELIPDEAARETVRGVMQSYLDGVWIETAQSGRKANAALARNDAIMTLDMLLRQVNA